MPVKIPNTLPARAVLESENVFVMGEERAAHQDIRPLQVAILNLMPTKIATETQLLRLLGNSSLQVDVTLLHTITHEARNTDVGHLLSQFRLPPSQALSLPITTDGHAAKYRFPKEIVSWGTAPPPDPNFTWW